MDPHGRPPRVFSVDGLVDRRWALARPALDRMLGLSRLERIYRARPADLGSAEFADWALGVLGVEYRCSAAELERVPERGPVVVVANHPFGGIEGLVLGRLLLERRPDVRVMANHLLAAVPELRELFLFVDPFGGPGAAQRNVAGQRQALRWIAANGLLVIFPSGTVAHFHVGSGRVEDPAWNPAVATFIDRVRCPVVPVHFKGANGAGFQLAGLLHPRLRTALLARALLAQRGAVVEPRIGSLVPYRRLEELEGPAQRIAYMRGRTEILAERAATPARDPVQPRSTPQHAEPIVPAVDPDLLERELAGLSPASRLVETDDEVVHVAEAGDIPHLLREIGRLREVTFREVGEGTGRAIDQDLFDERYLHLFAWNRKDRAVVGAYRLGLVDRLLADHGVDGLYTSTLFKFRRRLFEAMGPAIEMGRSWIRPEYQKSYQGLMLLWKGIGEFVVRHPRYATLFGPVSISAEYHSASQRLIVSFLEQNRYVHEWSPWVRPRTPLRPDRRTRLLELTDLEDVSAFIAEIEADHKGVPILLKQYLRLGGRLLGFNVDPDFSNVLDVLILVDLRRTDPRILARYMGREGTGAFLAQHRAVDSRAG
jgi:putative hemolysin